MDIGELDEAADAIDLAIERADRAVEIDDDTEARETWAAAIAVRGLVRYYRGDPRGGVEDLRERGTGAARHPRG